MVDYSPPYDEERDKEQAEIRRLNATVTMRELEALLKPMQEQIDILKRGVRALQSQRITYGDP